MHVQRVYKADGQSTGERKACLLSVPRRPALSYLSSPHWPFRSNKSVTSLPATGHSNREEGVQADLGGEALTSDLRISLLMEKKKESE